MERNMRDLQVVLDQRRWKALQVPLSVRVELVTHQLNHRRLRSLGNRNPYKVCHDTARRIQLHGDSRQRILLEVFQLFLQFTASGSSGISGGYFIGSNEIIRAKNQ
jgi:hypothetical protein